MSKKNAIVGQSGGPTAAINATLAGVIEGALSSNEINTLYNENDKLKQTVTNNELIITQLTNEQTDSKPAFDELNNKLQNISQENEELLIQIQTPLPKANLVFPETEESKATEKINSFLTAL